MATQHNFRIKNGLEVAGTERISSAGAITPQSLTVTADASVGGNLTITGNLVVNGSTTTIDTATLSVEDLNITVASGAGNSSAADGAGLTIAGASAIFAWDHAQGAMTLNKELRLDNNKGLFFRNSSSNGTLGLKADTSDNITFRQNGQWDRLVIKDDGVDIAGHIYTPNSISSGFASTLKGYFYESTVDQNGTGKPSSVLGLAANINSRGEGPSIDFNAVWTGAAGYQQDNWNEGWTVGRVAGVYDSSGLDTGALAFYTQTSGSSGGASSSSLTEKMRITSAGNVGIGVSVPLSPLSVQADGGAGVARFIGRAADNISSIGFYNNGQSADSYLQSNSSWIRARADGGFHFRKGNTPIVTDTDGFTINGMNLGIGTADPQRELHVHNSSSGATPTSNSVAVFEGNDNTEISILGGSSSVLAINFGHSGDNNEGLIYFNTTTGSENMQLQSTKDITYQVTSTNSTAGHHIFKSHNTEIMKIDGQHNRVGINVSPGSALTVKPSGSIGDGANIVDFIGSDINQRLIVANFACGSDEDRVGFIWENQGVALWRNWMDDDGHLRLKSSNPTHDHDGKRVVTETLVTGTSGGFLEQVRVYPGNVANYTGDVEGGINKGGTQFWVFSIQGNNTWYKVLTNMHDMTFEMFTAIGDAGSRDQASYSVNMTSPAYGVSSLNQNYYHNGGWNTGSFEYRFVATPGNNAQYDLECRFTSYYSSSNVATGYIHMRRLY